MGGPEAAHDGRYRDSRGPSPADVVPQTWIAECPIFVFGWRAGDTVYFRAVPTKAFPTRHTLSNQGTAVSYYLSVVLCGRNDDYRRDYLKRLQTFVSGLNHFCAQYALSCQVVFVEWNPPVDRPPIKQAINWGEHVGVKTVTVPASIDAQFPVNRGKSTLHEFIAKNAGIRRADGQFILSCTSDLVFSPELIQYLARRELTKDTVYRTTRVNVKALPDAVPPAQAPDFCRQNVLSVDTIGGRYAIDADGLEYLCRTNSMSILGFDFKLREIFDFTHDPDVFRLEAPALRRFPLLIFINGAGDFTLLSRDAWLNLGGYLETDCRNHVDAWFCYHAAKMGSAQTILPVRMCIYHQDHEQAPLLPFEETIQNLAKLNQTPNWGLAHEDLPWEVFQTGRI